jgi:hypothetical protein
MMNGVAEPYHLDAALNLAPGRHKNAVPTLTPFP